MKNLFEQIARNQLTFMVKEFIMERNAKTLNFLQQLRTLFAKTLRIVLIFLITSFFWPNSLLFLSYRCSKMIKNSPSGLKTNRNSLKIFSNANICLGTGCVRRTLPSITITQRHGIVRSLSIHWLFCGFPRGILNYGIIERLKWFLMELKLVNIKKHFRNQLFIVI